MQTDPADPAHLTEIAYILDRSGSMQWMVEPAIAGFNQFLAEQCDAPGHARLTLVLFDDQYEVPCRALPIAEVVGLDATTYVPRGTTALLDAIGRTIVELDERLGRPADHDGPPARRGPGGDRPSRVIVAIFTDGLENASRRFDHHQIAELIRHRREKHGWEFLFLAANQDAIATAARMGIDRSSAARIRSSSGGIHSSSTGISR